jgi:hypothetical protein
VGYSPTEVLIWNGSSLQAYLPAGSTLAQGWGITDAGVITGYADTGSGPRMFRYDSVNNVTEVRPEASFGQAINASNAVAGWGINGGVQEAALLTGALNSGTLQFLGRAPGGTFSRGLAISNSGVVVGTGNSSTASNTAIYWSAPGSPVELDRLGQPDGRANGVNSAGQIVGMVYGGALGNTGVIWEGFTAYDLTPLIVSNPGWDIRQADAINDLGQILGVGRLNGVDHIVRLDPVAIPEPATTWLALGAAAAALLRRQTRA